MLEDYYFKMLTNEKYKDQKSSEEMFAFLGSLDDEQLYEKYSNIKIYRHVNDLSRLMLNSDLFIGAGGTTTWERFYMGLPSIVTIISDDQKESIEFLSDMGHVINLGLAKNVTSKTYVQTLQKPNPDLIYNMSINNQKLVDGNGSNRIKRQITELINDV